MAKFWYAADKGGSRTHEPIQEPQSNRREASVQRATVVNSDCDEGMDKNGGSRSSEWAGDSAELVKLVEAVTAKQSICIIMLFAFSKRRAARSA